MDVLAEDLRFNNVYMGKTAHTTSWVLQLWVVLQQRLEEVNHCLLEVLLYMDNVLEKRKFVHWEKGASLAAEI
eukprot:12897947-Prorocentrum_lima.AAC.1